MIPAELKAELTARLYEPLPNACLQRVVDNRYALPLVRRT